MLKRLTSMLLVLVMVLPLMTVGTVMAEELPFSDVKNGNWFYSAVKTAYEQGIMKGQSEKEFAPSKAMTRAELVTMLSRLSGANVSGMSGKAASCKDIKGTEWYADYVGWGVSTGLVKGYSDGTFMAGNNIKRVELAVLFARFLDYMGITIDGGESSRYSDSTSIPSWAADDVETIRATGLMKGDDKGNFNPSASTTRAEVATLVSRLIVYIYEDELEGDDGTATVQIDETLSLDGLVSLLNGKFNADGEYDSPVIQNYSEIEDAIAAIEAGTSGNVTVKAVFTKKGLEIPVEYVVTVTKEASTPDYSEFLDDDGTVFTYNVDGEFPPEDVFDLWLIDLADTNNKYETIVIGGDGYSNLKNEADALSEGDEKSVDISVTFKSDEALDATKNYVIKLVYPVDWDSKVPETAEYDYPEFITFTADETAFTSWLGEKLGDTAFDTLTVENYDDVSAVAAGLEEGESRSIAVNVKFVKTDVVEVTGSYTVVFARGTDWEAKAPETGSYEYPEFLTFTDDEATFTSWILGKTGVTAFDSVTVTNFASVENAAENLDEGNTVTIDVSVKFVKTGTAEVNREYSVTFTRSTDWEAKVPESGTYTYTFKDKIDSETAFIGWLKGLTDTGDVFDEMTADMLPVLYFASNQTEGTKNNLNIAVIFKKGAATVNREYTVEFDKKINYENHVSENDTEFEYVYKYMPSEADFTLWLKGLADEESMLTSMTVADYSDIKVVGDVIDGGSARTISIGVTFVSAEGSFERSYKLKLVKNVDYEIFLPVNGSEYTYVFKNAMGSEADFVKWLKNATDENGKFESMTIGDFGTLSTCADEMEQGTTESKNVSVTYNVGAESFARTYSIKLDKRIDYSTFLLEADSVITMSFKGEFIGQSALETLIKNVADTQDKFDGMTVENYAVVKAFAENMTEDTTDDKVVNVKFTKSGEDDVIRSYTLEITRDINWETRLADNGSTYSMSFKKTFDSEDVFTSFIASSAVSSGSFTTVVTNYSDVKTTAEALEQGASGNITVNVTFTKDAENFNRTYTVNVTRKVELSSVIAVDGSEFAYSFTGIASESALTTVIKNGADKTGMSTTVTVADFSAISTTVNALEADGASTSLDVTVEFTGDGETVTRTYIVTFSKVSKYVDPNDTTPDNLGVQAEQAGVKVSNVVAVDQFFNKDSLGYHGGHDTRVVRNEYGTYMVFYTDFEYNENYPEGSEYADFGYWVIASLYKITPSGITKKYEYKYPKSSAAAPNIIAGSDGMFYLPVIADDKQRYLDAGLQDEGAYLMICEYNSKTDECNAYTFQVDYEIHWPTTYTGGYGYSQALLDEEHGRMYLMAAGGVYCGYNAFYTYDLNTHTLIGDCHTITTDYRLCYPNMYCDGNGGIIMVVQKAGQNDALSLYATEKYKDQLPDGVQIIVGNGSSGSYTWDSTHIIHIPDPTDFSNYQDVIVDEPDYINNIKRKAGKKWYAEGQSSKHYAGGCTYMDYNNNIHVLVTHGLNNSYVTYHKIYDTNLNLIYDETFSDVVPNARNLTNINMTQDENGKYWVFVSPGSGNTMSLELWSSTDGINFTKVTKFSAIKYTDGTTVSSQLKMIIGTGRNFSSLDGVVPFCFAEGDTYYYFSVELPD